MPTPKIKIPTGLPFRFTTALGEMELRKGPGISASEVIPHFLEVATVTGEKAWRLGEDQGLSPGYESIIAPGYELVDLANPACDDSLRTILETLGSAPGVEAIPEEVPLSL